MLSANVTALSELLTTKEAARYLRLSVPTLERMRCCGEGPPYSKLGPGQRARIVYRLDDLITYVNQNLRSSTNDRGR